MTRFRVWPALALAAGLFLAAGGTSAQFPQPAPAQPLPGQPVRVGAAGELPVVPKSAAAFLSVRVSDLADHPDFKPVLEQLKKTPDALEGVTELVGVAPHEIDRVTLFWPAIGARGPGEPVLVITTREPYNEARVLKGLKAEPVFDTDHRRGRGGHDWGGGAAKPTAGETKSARPATNPDLIKSPDPVKPPVPPAEKDEAEDACSATAAAAVPGDPLFYELPRGPFGLLFLVDDRTLVFLPTGFDSEVTQLALLSQLMQKKATGPLADAIAAGAGHTLAGGIYLPPLFREFAAGGFEKKLPPELAPYVALTAARTGLITGDLGKTAKLTLTLTFDDAAAAKRAGPVLEEGLKTLAAKAAEHAAEMKDARAGRDKALAPLFEAAAAGLKNAAVKANGTAVVATTEIDAGPAAAKAVAELLQSLQSRKRFVARSNNLKQIGIALHNYESAYGKLPTNVYNAKGEAILSWRVQLLPYLEENALYLQFKMDEPWDGPTNKKFAEQTPKVFEVPGREAPKGKTFYQAFVSPDPRKVPPKPPFGRAWFVEGDKNALSLARIPDGTANTIAVVEARDAAIWSKPDDLPFGEKLPPLGEEKADVFMALFFDGHVAAIPTKTDPAVLRALITTDGGEVVPLDFDDDGGPRRNVRPGGGDAGPIRPANPPKPPAADPGKDRLDELRNEAEAVEAFVEFARADLVKQQAETAAQRDRTKRIMELFAQGAATKKEVEGAKHDLEIADRRLKEREDAVRIRQDQLEEAKRALAKEAANPPKKEADPAPRPPEKK
jgi:Protein of unknown function (DUF1559)